MFSCPWRNPITHRIHWPNRCADCHRGALGGSQKTDWPPTTTPSCQQRPDFLTSNPIGFMGLVYLCTCTISQPFMQVNISEHGWYGNGHFENSKDLSYSNSRRLMRTHRSRFQVTVGNCLTNNIEVSKHETRSALAHWDRTNTGDLMS